MTFQNNHSFGKPKSSLRTVGTIFSLENRKKSILHIWQNTYILGSYPKHLQELPKTWQGNAQNIPEAYLSHV